MSWETIQIVIVLLLVTIVFFGMIRERIPPEVLAIGAVALLLAIGVLGIDDVLQVFSNTAPFTVGCMFVLSAALERTGVIDQIGQVLARIPWRSPVLALAATMLVVMGLSAFISNTPIVVIMTPVMIVLAHAMNVSASRMLIPLSYAAILGGTCTLIGTSTNIIVDGVAQRQGLAPFGIFEILLPGLIIALVGGAYIILVGRHLLPDRQTLSDALMDLSHRKFLTELLVPHGSPLIGKSLTEAGLTRQKGYTVIDVIGEGGSFDPDYGEPALAAGDRLVIRTSVTDFMGLRDAGTQHALEPIASRNIRMMEGIIGPSSSFVGQRVADLNLRRLYDTFILAIHRQNENLSGNFDEVRLQFGDTLLLEGPPEGLKRLFERQELVNLSEVTDRPFRRNKAWIATIAVAAVMVLSGFEVLPIAAVAFVAAIAVIVSGCLDADEAYKAIRWPVLMLIFGMLALGGAMETTGAGALIVGALVGAIGHLGPFVVLSAVYALTSLLTEFMSNNATAILLTPIAVGLAHELGVDPRPFVVAVMFAASASFATPLGYQTNTFVYGAGGYHFSDFTRVGLPLNLVLWLVASVVIPVFWPL